MRKDYEIEVECGKLGLWNWFFYKGGKIIAGGTTKTEERAEAVAERVIRLYLRKES